MTEQGSLSAREVFRRKYEDPASDWGGHSGAGSAAYFTVEYRSFISRFIRMNNIRSVVDIGCGDWQFSRFIDFDAARYLGLDVVPSVIEANRARYRNAQCDFDLMPEDLGDVPEGDLLLMKDVLQHLPETDIRQFIAHVFVKFKYCLLTNSYEHQRTSQNHDIVVGGFRCLDLTAAPYHLRGTYVLEFPSAVWERIRTLLLTQA
jgi:2-polyprenyl-3-methyl-5-hydroxy-6-metoxy-1,4-benzoquinol methylase